MLKRDGHGPIAAHHPRSSFRRIIVKTAARRLDGATRPTSRASSSEAKGYNAQARLNGHPARVWRSSFAPGADALRTAELVKAEVARQAKAFPAGYRYAFPQDSTDFVRLSIEEVVQERCSRPLCSWSSSCSFFCSRGVRRSFRQLRCRSSCSVRSACSRFFGFTVNTLTLFANGARDRVAGRRCDRRWWRNVERVMREQPGISAREATIRSMDEIPDCAHCDCTGALGGVPADGNFFGGSRCEIYRQFLHHHVAAMVLFGGRGAGALARTRRDAAEAAECGAGSAPRRGCAAYSTRLAGAFFEGFESLADRYRNLGQARAGSPHTGHGGVSAARRCSGSGVPVSAGRAFCRWKIKAGPRFSTPWPPGATMPRTMQAVRKIENYFLTEERQDVPTVFAIVGQSNAGAGQNAGRGFVALAPWSVRKARHAARPQSHGVATAKNRRPVADASSSR